tara:strand:- start:342 stop:1031 length:690 start_codon:yes stop_codon:yes gene_type:complete
MNYEYNRIIDEQRSMTDHRKYSSPIPRPESPTNAQYKSGKFFRYFVISEIDARVIEIDEEQYTTVSSADKGISPHLWKPIRIKWKLKGPRFDISKNGIMQKKGVVNVNKATVDNIAKRNPKIMSTVRDYTLFATMDVGIRENLLALKGELVYRNAPLREYKGLYHIHPEKGPMEGAYHGDAPHELLMLKAESVDASYESESSQYANVTFPQGGGSSGGESSSGGSSGGY